MKRILLALLLATAPVAALAQSSYPTSDQDARAPLVLQGCLNASGRVVPCSSAGAIGPPAPANAAQETGGNLAALLARTPPLNAAGQSPVADPNNAAYSAAGSTFATGATVTAGRAIYLNCSASGSVTMSLSGGGSLAYPVAAGANVLPFAVTAVSADTASCTHQNIN